MVALNAWDWDTAAVTFGTISYVDCDIHHCMIEGISGIYILENLLIAFKKEEFIKKGMTLMKIGPLSAVWKNNSENPDIVKNVFL